MFTFQEVLQRLSVLSGSHLEGAVQSLGFQVPDVNTVVQTSTDQKLRRGTQTYTGLSFLSG